MRIVLKIIISSLFSVGVLFLVLIFMTPYVWANTIGDLKGSIDNKNTELQQIEAEIDRYERELANTQSQARSLSSSIYELDTTQKKLGADINYTQNRIDTTSLSLEKLSLEIDKTEESMVSNKEAIKKILQTINEVESDSLVEVMLSADNLSTFWNNLESLDKFRNVFTLNLDSLEMLKDDLINKKYQESVSRDELETLSSQFKDKKIIIDSNQREKSSLLAQTKNKEADYKYVLAQKKEAKEAFEAELAQYEAQLKYALDASKIPPKGSGVLKWPLPDISLDSCYDGSTSAINCVTQYFGNTKFAMSGAYDGNGHNGIDFRASEGTPILASANGIVTAIGNTDQYPGCYSYGKWALTEYDNGLSILTAHHSLTKVVVGQKVKTGELIAYSGNTGYSTGPHLHMTVFAADAVNIVRLGDIKKVTGCPDANIPVAAHNAYFNPLDFLSSN